MKYRKGARLVWLAEVCAGVFTVATITAACAGVRSDRPKHPVTLRAVGIEEAPTCISPVVYRREFTWISHRE